MPTQRSVRGHLPSHSGDFTNEARAWRKLSSGPGIDLKGIIDTDEENGKSPLTKLRVWLASIFHLTGSTTRHGLRTRPARTRRNIALLVFCACVLYIWMPFGSRSNGTTTPQFEAREAPRQEPPRRKLRAASHTYRPDGFLEVNPNGTHPIFDLITKAEAAWYAKLRRASSTFQEAVEEYVRRHNRPPPKGFDKWYVKNILICLSYLIASQVGICSREQSATA